MRKIISNTSPILLLIKLSRLDILQKLYSEILIPEAVYFELEQGKDKPHYHDISNESWIKIMTVENCPALEAQSMLGAGEHEAISLALETKADLIILDDKLARKTAEEKGLKITGTLGVLFKAREKGIIKEIKPLLLQLRNQGMWIKDDFFDKIMQM